MSRRIREGPRSGLTLVELLVTLAILGLVAGIVGLSVHRAAGIESVDPAMARLTAARSEALGTKRPVTVALEIDGRRHEATALPDGSVIADSIFAVERLSGRPSLRKAARP